MKLTRERELEKIGIKLIPLTLSDNYHSIEYHRRFVIVDKLPEGFEIFRINENTLILWSDSDKSYEYYCYYSRDDDGLRKENYICIKKGN